MLEDKRSIFDLPKAMAPFNDVFWKRLEENPSHNRPIDLRALPDGALYLIWLSCEIVLQLLVHHSHLLTIISCTSQKLVEETCCLHGSQSAVFMEA